MLTAVIAMAYSDHCILPLEIGFAIRNCCAIKFLPSLLKHASSITYHPQCLAQKRIATCLSCNLSPQAVEADPVMLSLCLPVEADHVQLQLPAGIASI